MKIISTILYILFIFFIYLVYISGDNIYFSAKKNKKVYPNTFNIIDKIYKPNIQEKALSCESSATADILSTLLHKEITEDNVLKKLDMPWQYQKSIGAINGHYFWGDPNNGFIGNIDFDKNGKKASQRKKTGYGVLERPIAKVYHKYGFRTKTITKYDYTKRFQEKEHMFVLLASLTKGHMVQLWGDWCTDQRYDDGKLITTSTELIKEDRKENNAKNSCFKGHDNNRTLKWLYLTPDYKIQKHIGLNGEHAFYLLGYKGSIRNPSSIIVWDTDTGYHELPYFEWKRKWNLMQNRSIIIYKKQVKKED